MIRINHLHETRQIMADHELWREVHGFLFVCLSELKEYADEEDLGGHEFNFLIATTSADVTYVKSLGEPEEIAIIDVRCGRSSRKLRRMIFVTEVVFIDEEIALDFLTDG